MDEGTEVPTVKVGVQFSQPVDPQAAPKECLDTYLSLISQAWNAGFDSYWAGQHFLLGDGYVQPQPLPLLARASAEVPGMTLGTAVLLLPLLNPVDAAEQAATLDALTDNRFVLGVGLGYRTQELRAAGLEREHVLPRFVEAIEVHDRLRGNVQRPFEGAHFALEEGTGGPRKPLLIGAHVDTGVVRAARLSDGWIVPAQTTYRDLSRKMSLFREAAAEAGRPGKTVLSRIFHVTRDQSEAERVRSLVTAHLERKRSWKTYSPDGARVAAEEDQFVVGDPGYCVAELMRCVEKFGPSELLLLTGFSGIPTGDLRRCLDLAGAEVMPALRAAA